MSSTTSTKGSFAPDYVVPPGDTVADLLEEWDMTQTDLARRLGVSLKHVNQIVNGMSSISADLALGLEKVFAVPAGFWVNREAQYRAGLARQREQLALEKALSWAKQFPVSELKKRGFIEKDARGRDLAAEVLRFFGVATQKQWVDITASFRKSQKFESDPFALSAWLRVGTYRAGEIQCGPYDPDRFRRALTTARSLTRLDPDEWHPKLTKLCAEAGVALVVEEAFTKARANGATRWLSPTKALVQLSLRGKWEDIFWFTFFHESGHVLLHRKKEIFIEPSKRPTAAGAADSHWLRQEQEADRFAANALIPPRYEGWLAQLKLDEVESFADRLGIAPAIVVGRLQHDQLLPPNHGNKLRRRLTFSSET